MSAVTLRAPLPHCTRVLASALVWGLLLGGSDLARADPRTDPHPNPRAGHEGLNLPEGSLRVSAALEVGLDIRSLGAPISLAPDLHLGVTDRLTLGLIHSGLALDRMGSGWGLCGTGPDKGCDHAYSGMGLDSIFTFWRTRGVELATQTRLYVARFSDPLKLRVTLGLKGIFRAGPVAIHLDPHLAIGVTHREEGNGDVLHVPIHLFVALGRHVALYLRTGLRGLLRSFADQYAIPLGVGVLVRPTPRWRVGAQIVLRQLLGPLNTYTKRDLFIYMDFRFGPGH